MSYQDFPWFKQQPIEAVLNVEEPSPEHYYWPALDVDLTKEIIKNPETCPSSGKRVSYRPIPCTGGKSMQTALLATLKLVSVAAIISWLLAMAQTAVAEEGGSFTSLYSYQLNSTTIDHADGKITGSSFSGTRTVLESSGAPFLKGSVSVANCISYVRTTEAGIDLEAPCTATDKDNDRLFIVSKRTSSVAKKLQLTRNKT